MLVGSDPYVISGICDSVIAGHIASPSSGLRNRVAPRLWKVKGASREGDTSSYLKSKSKISLPHSKGSKVIIPDLLLTYYHRFPVFRLG